MQIKILGSGCPNCNRLEVNTRLALEQLGLEAEVTKVTDMAEIMSYGVMSTPALVVNDEVLLAGQASSPRAVAKILVR
jgi:small redox-active disulfide protein 2